MSIWVDVNSIERDKLQKIINSCLITKELDYFEQKKKLKAEQVLMLDYDPSGKYYMIPYNLAKSFGYEPNNTCWREVIIKTTINGEEKYLPEFVSSFRDYQLEVIHQIKYYLETKNTVIIGYPPGYGKSILGIYFSFLSKLLTIVIVSKLTVMSGWITSFQKSMPKARLWIVGENNPLEYDVIICMNGRLNMIPQNIKNQVGTLIIDEVHTITTPTQVNTFLLFQPKYIIFETATLEQSKFYKMATLCSGEHGVFKTSSAPYFVFTVETHIQGDEKRTKDNTLVSSHTQKSLINDEIRKKIIQMIIYNHIKYRKFILLQKVTDCIEETVDNIKNCGISADFLFGTKKEYNQSRVLVGTFSKLSVGFDEENACKTYYTNPEKSNTIIFANSVASKYVFEQSRCRCRVSDKGVAACTATVEDLKNKFNGIKSDKLKEDDEFLWVIFLLDENKNVQSNFRNLLPWIKETNGLVINVDARSLFMKNLPIKYNPLYNDGIYYRVVTQNEYEILILDGFYCGNEDEKKHKLVTLYTQTYMSSLKNETGINYIILQIHECLLLTHNDQIYENNGLVYSKHPIFLKNIIGVNYFIKK